MALALSSSRLLNALSLLTQRRGYAAAATVGSARRAEAAAESKAASFMGEMKESAAAETAWVPDPETGYYRPANRLREVDAAELRAMLLGRGARE